LDPSYLIVNKNTNSSNNLYYEVYIKYNINIFVFNYQLIIDKMILFRRTVIVFLAIMFSMGGIYSQSVHLPRSLVVEIQAEYGLISKYVVKPRNTLYSICKSYRINYELLEEANIGSRLPAINPGDTLLIPFNLEMVDLTVLEGNALDAIPVYYKTMKGDNLFRIARVYFDHNLAHLMQMNSLQDTYLKPGQLILIGWHTPTFESENYDNSEEVVSILHPLENVDSVSDHHKITDVNAGPSALSNFSEKDTKQNRVTKDSTDHTREPQKILSQNGLAIWNRTSRAKGSFALHNQARIGTMLEVTNPLLKRRSYIRVIGRIPDNSYPNNVRVILSPDAARELGALDPRFFVKMNYIAN